MKSKKLLKLLLAAFMSVSLSSTILQTGIKDVSAAQENTVSVSLEGSERLILEDESKASYIVKVSNMKDANAFDITISYDSDSLVYRGYDLCIDGIQVYRTNEENGKVRLVMGSTNNISVNELSDLIKFNFWLKTSTNNENAYVKLERMDVAGNGVSYNVERGNNEAVSTISSYYNNSDLTNDKNVTIEDLSAALKYYCANESNADWETSKKADINFDGTVDSADYIMLSQFIKDSKFDLTLLHTNDLHGRVGGVTNSSDGRQDGTGMPEYSTIIKKVSANKKNTLALDAGDIFLRGPYEKYQGKMEMDMLNKVGMDAWVLGNNEFRSPNIDGSNDNTVGTAGSLEMVDKQVDSLIHQANFPTLCANVKVNSTGDYIVGTQPYMIKIIDGVRVGIIGVTSTKPADRNWESASNKTFESAEITVANLLPEVREKSDVVIVLSHAGIDVDRKITGVDAIVSADTHLFMEEPESPNGFPIYQVGGEQNNHLGEFSLSFTLNDEDRFNLSAFNGKSYTGEGYEADSAINEIIESYTSSNN